MPDIKTNEQRIKALMKEMNTYEVALFAERLLRIAEITRNAIAVNPKPFNTGFTSAKMYLDVCDKIDKHFKIRD